ncbi:glycosyl hydrolase family 8 [Phaeobacter italicus]|uniref:glycosyl hydrolase family 8 n=1 Tax=Phaeobacter italicus TaxID=481446 RepID=UPI00242B6E5A|nr:glycosyl hydrolase family 8 [Phaeobacter italicus]MCI5101166.1 glycosyl hydrolase family 8 [Phaeobacter italicus]
MSGNEAPLTFEQNWGLWKGAFLRPDGRVVDTLQSRASHSEGQGYGLILAACAGDRAAFDLIQGWTFRTLMVRDSDRLFAWRWQANVGIEDRNNATDGDLLIAWGLCLGAQRFGAAHLKDLAALIVQDIILHTIVADPRGGKHYVMRPGVVGFDREDGLLVNPSYYVFPALYELSQTFELPILSQLANDGLQLLADMSQTGLPLDWCVLTRDGYVADTQKSRHFGYEGMRIPLYLAMAGMSGHPAVRRVATLWQHSLKPSTPFPTVIDPVTFATRETSHEPGYAGMASHVLCALGQSVPPPRFVADQSYYPATLHLLAISGAGITLKGCA